MVDEIIIRDERFRIVVKGREDAVRDALAKRKMIAHKLQPGVCGTIASVTSSYLELFRWFTETESRGAPYPDGTLLHYTPETDARRATR
jgi:hypothetical protein